MDKHSSEENRIIEGCAIKSEKHQEMLYKLYYGYVMAISLTYCTDRCVAQEITDDSFMKVFNSIDKFNNKLPFKAWLRRITVNTAIDNYRRNKKHMNHLDISESSIGLPTADMIDQLTIDDIDKLIGQLPDVLKMVFNLYEIEGYDHQEIARSLNISESSSRTYLMRAKIKLGKLVKKHFD